MTNTLSDRRGIWAFVLGCVAVTIGVALHLPMFLAAGSMDYRMAGMPMDSGMIVGMALIVGGVAIAGYGLLPRNLAAQRASTAGLVVAAPEDAALGWPHWQLMMVLTVALVIDVMKPASLGFTVPGMASEYAVPKSTVSLVPFFALMGTVAGSILWGAIADIYGRKASILLSAVMFVGTSICGAMPSLAWNVGMCFMMGAAAGGMLPVTYSLLAEMMPNRHRGWSLVLVGGLGAAGGYFAASGLSAILQPLFGWRVLWLLNLPTGLILILMGVMIPESAKFLVARGRLGEAHAVMQRFGARMIDVPLKEQPAESSNDARVTGRVIALSVAALAWGLINFGLLLWLPADLVAKGTSVGLTSRLLAQSALIAFPTVFVAALLYSRWSTKWSLVAMIGVTIAGLLGTLHMEQTGASPVLPVALLIVGSNAIIAMILPYAAESFPLRMRGRGTGLVAACTKAGGLIAQTLALVALVPSMGVAAGLILVPTIIAMALVAVFGRETRGKDLRQLDFASVPAE